MRRWIVIGLAVLVTAGVAWALWPGGCADGNAEGNTAGPAATSTSAGDYWTPERMRDARGAPQPLDSDC
jgi:hypothetical protein